MQEGGKKTQVWERRMSCAGACNVFHRLLSRMLVRRFGAILGSSGNVGQLGST